MKRLYLIVVLSALGLVFTGLLVYKDSAPLRGRSEPIPVWHPPFASFVAGTGIVEAASTNISVGSPVSGIVEKLYVKPGSLVRRGEPLFKLDDRKLRARLPLLESVAVTKNIKIQQFLDKGAMVNVDEDMLKTVLRNLISNAIKFTPRGGQITVVVRCIDSIVETSVIDTGVGIPPDKIDNIFNDEATIKTKGTENESGTGLGLILCKEFIAKHPLLMLVRLEYQLDLHLHG